MIVRRFTQNAETPGLQSLRNHVPRSLVSAGFCLALLLSFCPDRRCSAQDRPASESSALQQAETLINQGHFQDARALVDNEIKKNPSNAAAYDLLGVIESNQQDASNALTSFEKALAIAPNSPITHNNLGDFYLTQKKPELAEREFRTAVKIAPGDADGNYNLALLLMARGSAAEAIPHFERVHPMTIASSINLIRANFQAKRTEEALRLSRSLSDANPSNVQVNFTLGVLLASQKQYKLALRDLEKADALQPGTFEIPFNLGQAYLLNGQFSDAEITLTRALKLKPDSPETLYLLAQTYANESRPRDALELLVHAHKIAPANVDVIYLLAQVSMSQKYYEDAIPLLEAGLQLAPKRSDLIAALGQSYFIAGKPEQAIQQFKRLIEIDPSSHSYAYLGTTYREMGRFREAKQALQSGLKVNSHDGSCLFNLGLIAAQQGDTANAEAMFRKVLLASPDFPDALLELANLRIQAKRFSDAEVLLRHYVRVSPNPSAGYYKLSMVETNLHETVEADRDLKVFQTLLRDVSYGPHHYEHLYDYIDSRAKLAPQAREQLDMTELLDHIKKYPGRPDDLYSLASEYFREGNANAATDAIAQLDKISLGDYRTLTGTGVLLARYHRFGDAIQHFQMALEANPTSNEEEFDLADAYFEDGQYTEASQAIEKISPDGRADDAYLQLVGDINVHLGEFAKARDAFREAISHSPDGDQGYLSLALLDLRQNDLQGAFEVLENGQQRCPSSGKILWGLGIVSALTGDTAKAADQLEHAVNLLPEWSGSYSLLGVFYFQTGQVAKAREVFERFKHSTSSGELDSSRISRVLAQTAATSDASDQPLSTAGKQQFLQVALSLADKTL